MQNPKLRYFKLFEFFDHTWYTWQGECIEGKGVVPDILVENSPESLATGADPQVEKALESVKIV